MAAARERIFCVFCCMEAFKGKYVLLICKDRFVAALCVLVSSFWFRNRPLQTTELWSLTVHIRDPLVRIPVARGWLTHMKQDPSHKQQKATRNETSSSLLWVQRTPWPGAVTLRGAPLWGSELCHSTGGWALPFHRRPGFNPLWLEVRFVVGEVALEQGFLWWWRK
jgi:hypothetical protein